MVQIKQIKSAANTKANKFSKKPPPQLQFASSDEDSDEEELDDEEAEDEEILDEELEGEEVEDEDLENEDLEDEDLEDEEEDEGFFLIYCKMFLNFCFLI